MEAVGSSDDETGRERIVASARGARSHTLFMLGAGHVMVAHAFGIKRILE